MNDPHGIAIQRIEDGRSELCREVLDDLPEWFANEESKCMYAAGVAELPTLIAVVAGERAGLVALKRLTPASSELFVLAVKRRYHRAGVGRALIAAAMRLARTDGARVLTVKTLGPSHPDRNYAATRRFYEAVGFLPIEEFPTMWGEGVPCLLMARMIDGPSQGEGGIA